MKAAASGAGGRPVRKPWIPPRFECVDAALVGSGHPYYDHDDSTTPGVGKTSDPDFMAPTWDQTNPYNS